jgi:hypothetical protein
VTLSLRDETHCVRLSNAVISEGSIPFTRSIDSKGFSHLCSKSAVKYREVIASLSDRTTPPILAEAVT